MALDRLRAPQGGAPTSSERRRSLLGNDDAQLAACRAGRAVSGLRKADGRSDEHDATGRRQCAEKEPHATAIGAAASDLNPC
jgi:hypothetical protein